MSKVQSLKGEIDRVNIEIQVGAARPGGPWRPLAACGSRTRTARWRGGARERAAGRQRQAAAGGLLASGLGPDPDTRATPVHQPQAAERDYDLNRAAELKYGTLLQLQKALAEAEAALDQAEKVGGLPGGSLARGVVHRLGAGARGGPHAAHRAACLPLPPGPHHRPALPCPDPPRCPAGQPHAAQRGDGGRHRRDCVQVDRHPGGVAQGQVRAGGTRDEAHAHALARATP